MSYQTTALITGASSGIGKELARVHASKGGNLILTARNLQALESLANDLSDSFGVQCFVIPMDLSTPNAAVSLYQSVQALPLKVDYLFNNAGFGEAAPFEAYPVKTDTDMLQVNVVVLTELTKLFGMDFLKRGKGKIVNIASVAGFLSGPGMAVYFASKNYVKAFGEALHYEWKDKGVTVTTVCPGPTESGFFDRANMHNMRMIQWMKNPDSLTVAKFAYKAMEKGKRIAVHGLLNKLQIQLSAFVPSSLSLAIISQAMKKAK
jgi:short-subunit dehydrogenase